MSNPLRLYNGGDKQIQGIRCDRVPEELQKEVHDTVQEAGIKTIPKKKKCKKAKWLSDETLQIAEKRREAKGKGEKERYTHLNAEFQRIARRNKKKPSSKKKKKKPSSEINAKKQRKTTEWKRLEISSTKLEISREHFMQRWAQKWYGPNRYRRC